MRVNPDHFVLKIMINMLIGIALWGIGTWAIITMWVVYDIRCFPVHALVFLIMIWSAIATVQAIWIE